MSGFSSGSTGIITPVTVPDGGTGLITITDHGVMVGSGANPVTALAVGTTGTTLLGSTGADPSWGQLDLTTVVTGILPVPNGGTGLATITDHGLMVGAGVGVVNPLAVGTTNTVLLGNTGADPSWGQVDITTDITGILPIANGGTGLTTITDHGIMLGAGAGVVNPLAVGTTNTVLLGNTGADPSWGQVDLTTDVTGILPYANTPLGVATDGQVLIGSTGVDPVLANITSALDLAVVNGAGTIDITLDADTNITAVHGWNGSFLETADVTVAAAGGVITLSIEKTGTGNLTAVFSDGFYNYVTAPDTVTLTAGTDVAPTLNYVYLLQSTKTLTASIAGWPATEFCAIATVLCQSAASLQTDGAYKVHVWTDHVVSPTDQGHVSMISRWIRQQNATWESGVAPTLTITPNGGAADNVIFTSSAGVVYQLHPHTFPAFAGTPDVYTVNDFTTPYNVVTDLNALLTDSANGSMSGKYFSLVIWGVVNEDTGDCKLMVNLPGGSYNTQALLLADSNKYANFSIPTDFIGTGFLVYQMNLRHQVAASGTWTSISNIDLRGLFPATAAGGSTAFATEFSDNVFRIFDDTDNTRELAFQLVGVSSGTTRTITMDDRDIDMDAVATSVTCDGGSAVPASGILSIVGAGSLVTSGAGSIVTVSGGGIIWNEVTGTSQAAVINNGYITNNGALVTVTLPSIAAVGSVVRVMGLGAGGWKIAQNASQYVRWDEASVTTTGAGGSLASTDDHDAISLICTVTNNGWGVLDSPKGNITIV